ncbi:hypothetical protein BDQ17DRAFT_685197 [Cyathus striatus]|nr:hypothetical protein BDQ17DRAFT_685197 [Cyathus striatus]
MGSRSASARHRQTPYSAPRQMSREDSEDSNYEHEHEHEHEHEREPLHYETPRDPEPTMRVIQPMDPAPAAVYGPPEDDDLRPIKHPLPPPPRDLYELTPYKTLFNLPQTTALLTATYGDGMNAPLGVRPQQAAPAPATAPPPERKRTRKGLFRAFSTRREQPPPPAPAPPEPNVRYVPVPMYIPVGGPLGATGGAAGEPPQTAGFQPPQQQQQQQMHPQDTGYPTPQQPQSVGFQPPPQQQQMPPQQDGYQTPQQVRSMPPEPASIIPGPPPVIPGGTPSNQYFAGGAGPNVPPQMQIHASSSTDSQIIRFDQTSQYAGFLNHSPHRVLYNNKTYPSATHLHEAMKYIENRPEIAEFIRTCPNIHDVYPLSAQYQQYQRADWGQLFMSLMEEVLFLKFRQHPDLRALLLKTGEAILRYADGKDPFWGEGPDGSGRNELGKALMKVRRKLVEANFAP